MALLEGHADVAMDEVGPRVVPSVRKIRKAFEARRDEAGEGARAATGCCAGCSASTPSSRSTATAPRSSGRCARTSASTGSTRCWTSAEHLPLPQEIADPRAWVRRVHG